MLADALSRRPDYELAHVVHLESTLFELIRGANSLDPDFRGVIEALGTSSNIVKLKKRQQAHLHRYSLSDGLLLYSVNPGDEKRVVVPNDEDLRHRILYDAYDTPGSGHLGREKTYTSVAREFWWPHMYKWVRSYVKTCETCLRVKPLPCSAAPLQSLPVPEDCWRSVSMDFIPLIYWQIGMVILGLCFSCAASARWCN